MFDLSWYHWILLGILGCVAVVLQLGWVMQRFVSRCLGIMLVYPGFMTPCQIVSCYRVNYRSWMSHVLQQTLLTHIALPNLEQLGDVMSTQNMLFPCHCEKMYRPTDKLIARAEKENGAIDVYIISTPGPMP